MIMYSYSETNPVLLEKISGGWEYSIIKHKTGRAPRLEIVEPRSYNYWLDRVLECENIPPTMPGGLMQPFVGDLYDVNGMVVKVEAIVPGRALVFQILTGRRDGFLELTEGEAKGLGLAWKEGLVPFSTSTKLRAHDPTTVKYNPSDLSTYPKTTLLDDVPEIQYMLLVIPGFRNTQDKGIIETPEGDLVPLELLVVSLGVRLRRSIKRFPGYVGFDEGEDLEYSFVTEPYYGSLRSGDDELLDTDGKITLIVRLKKDGHGVNSLALRGLTANDLFDVTWEAGSEVLRSGKTKYINYSCQIFRKEESGRSFRIKVGKEYTKLRVVI